MGRLKSIFWNLCNNEWMEKEQKAQFFAVNLVGPARELFQEVSNEQYCL